MKTPYNDRHTFMALASGTKLGPYEILSALGAGGMGEVYRAHDPRLGREVAIKVLPSGSAPDSERLRRFEQEARATAALNHPNILAVFDIGSQDNSPYIVSELLDGETLRARLNSGTLPVRKAAEYALQISRGLAAAHDHGIFHRDLKPENIFITRDGHDRAGRARRVRTRGTRFRDRPRRSAGNARLHISRAMPRGHYRRALRHLQ